MSFPQYPEYKDSGVEWLGEVPAHWRLGSFRHLIKSLSNGTTANQVDQDDGSVAVSRIETISKGEVDFSKVGYVRSSEVDKRFLLKAGDILFSHINSLPMIGNAAVYVGDKPLLHGMNLLRIQPEKSVVSSWVAYWLKSKNIRQEVESRAKPAINQASISTGSVKSLPALIPPESEQRDITSFLDHETARIDALVEQQKRLIELLKEKRQAVISHAITKGLDPDVPMKDSGVEWLGEVPAHWEVSRLGWVSRVDSGHPFPAELFGFDGIPVIRMSDMKDGDVSDASIKRVPVESVPDRAFAKIGDLLIGLSGSISNHAVIKDCDLPCAINQRVGVIRGSQGANFLRYYIQSTSFLEQTAAELEETTIQNISMGQVRSCKVAWPSRDERNHIATFLDHETARIDALMQEGESVINLLQERRSALISAAVTGKIDVRGWQPPSGSSASNEATKTEMV